ncbi:aminoglycoside phosphotransferase family protein [Halomonas sp. NO4]|uniref:aminoglycoside phosphotransferase family protein n=1 Tax=Halomonas sp. NO4 TaxID=2484813 RepID=UPI0013D27FA8|nr:aminoglycoside phosphotransferase family protein [Halomonas sp. NO4]
MSDTVTHTSPATRDLCNRLERALTRAGRGGGVRDLRPMADTGLAHHHLWLTRDGDDWVARLPKQSQLGLDAHANLDYQAACFERAGRSGHAPSLHGVLSPSEELPRGGLLVSAVRGRAARLPADLPAIAEALAHLHGLPLPPRDKRPPLLAPADPWAAMREEVAGQADYLEAAGLTAAVRQRLENELAALPTQLPDSATARPRLISFDAHPGNFLIRDDGSAVLVDLEKCRYGLTGFDLAHASLYTSTTWDVASHAELSPAQVADFYRRWMAISGLDDVATLLTCRRAMWLWSLTWCAKWRASHGRAQDTEAQGEDWSAELSDAALIAHVRDRVDHYLSLPAIKHVQREFDALATTLEKDA